MVRYTVFLPYATEHDQLNWTYNEILFFIQNMKIIFPHESVDVFLIMPYCYIAYFNFVMDTNFKILYHLYPFHFRFCSEIHCLYLLLNFLFRL